MPRKVFKFALIYFSKQLRNLRKSALIAPPPKIKQRYSSPSEKFCSQVFIFNSDGSIALLNK